MVLWKALLLTRNLLCPLYRSWATALNLFQDPLSGAGRTHCLPAEAILLLAACTVFNYYVRKRDDDQSCT